jgi:splicing factor 3B subunit 3
MLPQQNSEKAFVCLYRFLNDGFQLQFFSETQVDVPPLAMLAFKGKLLAGIGRDLTLFDLGKISLMRKALAKNATGSRIVGLKTQGSRIIVADQRESVVYVVHKEGVRPNRLIPFADDSVKRHTTAIQMVDYESVAGADKFGNIWIVRCPPKVSESADETDDGTHLLQEKPYLGGTPNRHDLVMHYFTNDIPMAIQKAPLVAGGDPVLVWGGLQGTIAVLIPFASRREFKMFQELQAKMREEDKSLVGRDHLSFRGQYSPVKNVLDGDLIERFLALSLSKREKIASMLEGGWDVEQVETQIWNKRGLYAF